MKLALLTASLLLAGGTLTACGDDPEGSEDTVSVNEFCGAILDVQEAYAEVDQDDPTEEQVRGVKDSVEALTEQGLPEDVSEDARAGLELIAEEVGDLPDDASAEQLMTAGEDFSDEDEVKSDAFDDYVETTCADPGEEPMPDDTASPE